MTTKHCLYIFGLEAYLNGPIYLNWIKHFNSLFGWRNVRKE